MDLKLMRIQRIIKSPMIFLCVKNQKKALMLEVSQIGLFCTCFTSLFQVAVDRDLFAKKTKTLNENLVVDQLHNKTKLKNQQKQTSKYKFEKVIALKNARKEVQSTMEKKKLETVRTLQHQKQRMNKEMANRLTFKKKTNKQKKSI